MIQGIIYMQTELPEWGQIARELNLVQLSVTNLELDRAIGILRNDFSKEHAFAALRPERRYLLHGCLVTEKRAKHNSSYNLALVLNYESGNRKGVFKLLSELRLPFA